MEEQEHFAHCLAEARGERAVPATYILLQNNITLLHARNQKFPYLLFKMLDPPGVFQ